MAYNNCINTIVDISLIAIAPLKEIKKLEHSNVWVTIRTIKKGP